MNKPRAFLSRVVHSATVRQAVAVAFVVGAAAARAEGTDTSAVTNAVTAALAFAAAIGAAMIAIWGSKLAYRKFFGS